MTSPETKDMKVLIIGAGATGLLVSQGLKKHSIPFEIFEQEASDSYKSKREWGMTIHWGARQFPTCLPEHLVERLPSIAADQYYDPKSQKPGFPLCNLATGEEMHRIVGTSPMRSSRRKMRALFSEGVNIQYNKTFTRYEVVDGVVKAYFSDGTSVTGSHLVGTDSTRSTLRHLLLDEESAALTELPYRLMTFSTSYPRDQALFLRSVHPIVKTAAHPTKSVMILITIVDVPSPSEPESWIFQTTTTISNAEISAEALKNVGGDYGERLKFLKELAVDFAEPFRNSILWAKNGTRVADSPLRIWKDPKKWNNEGGRVTLAGDAAHTMTNHRAQGVNNDIEDAGQFVQAMVKIKEGESSSTAIDAYDAEVLQRGRDEILLSYKQTLAFHNFDTLMQSFIVTKGLDVDKVPNIVAAVNICG